MSALDAAVAAYRRELVASADLARADLDELEDHFRALVGELTAAGVPDGDAIAQAARRLGEPVAIAREHARTRSAFGMRQSPRRAWGAVALMLPFFAHNAATNPNHMFVAILAAVTLAATASRLTWARALLVGWLPVSCFNLVLALSDDARPLIALNLAAWLGATALLVPWRRRELSAAGWSLAMIAWAFGSVGSIGGFLGYRAALHMTDSSGAVLPNTYAWIATIGVIVAAAGGLLRARWGAIGAAVAACALPMIAAMVWPLTFRMASPLLWRAWMFGSLAICELGVIGAAIVMWRTARSSLGSLRALGR